MKWINALGLILQFLSFWLAAPELLGETTLKRFEAGLRKFISSIPIIIFSIIAFCYGLYFGIAGTMKGIKASQEGQTIQEYYSFYILMCLATILHLILVFRYKKVIAWLDVKFAKPINRSTNQ